MAGLDVTIKILSPIHLGSGQANVNVDAEIVHDALGLPYFPAKRFKGLLYESAIEVLEMFRLSGLDTQNLSDAETIFHRQSVSKVQLIVPNFFIRPLAEYEELYKEWNFLEAHYPKIFTAKDVLNSFTSLRYQIKIDKDTGTTERGSLRNLRVLDAGTEFFGRITVRHADEKILNLLALAIQNLTAAGTKRNRGFGRLKCTATFDDGSTAQSRTEKFFAKEAR